MALNAQDTPQTTRMLEQLDDEDDAALNVVVAPSPLDARTWTILQGVSALIVLSNLAGNISAFSVIDLTRSIACAEHYRNTNTTPPPSSADCQIGAVDARHSDIMAAITSLNSIAACFGTLVVFPLVIRKLGHRAAILLGVVVLALNRSFYVWLASAAQSSLGKDVIHPTTALHYILAQAFVFGLVGDSLLDMVAQAVVLDTVPVALRSTWLARLQSCASIGGLASTAVLQMFKLDTSSDLFVDTLPIRIGAALALATVLIGLAVFFYNGESAEASLHSSVAAEQMSSSPSDNTPVTKLTRGIRQSFRPLRLLFRPTNHPNRSLKPDWRLSKVLFASLLYGEITVAGNLVIFYCQSRFHIHAKETSLLSGLLNFCAWIYLSFGFSRIAGWVRKSAVQASSAVEQSNPAPQLNPIPAERWLTIGSLAMDIVSWTIFTLAGRAGSYALFKVGTITLSLSLAGSSSLTSLGSVLIPEGIETDELLAAFFFIDNAASAVGPMLNTRVYKLGLQIQTPELIFVFMGALSFVSMMTVISVRSTLVQRSSA